MYHIKLKHVCFFKENIIKPPDEVKKLKIAEDEDVGEEEIAFEDRYSLKQS